MSNIDSSPFTVWMDGVLSICPEIDEDFELESDLNISQEISSGAEILSEQLMDLLDNVERQPDLGSLMQSYFLWAFPTALAVGALLAQGTLEDYASCLPEMIERCPELQEALEAYLEAPQRDLLILLVRSWMAAREGSEILLRDLKLDPAQLTT